MLRIYRGNRIETLATLLAARLRLEPPDPFTPVEVLVNTWPTSRWLGERLAVELGGVAANLRFPFPGSRLRSLVEEILDPAATAGPVGGGPDRPVAADPWRAERLVWSVLPLLNELTALPEAAPLRRWLKDRDPSRQLRLDTWTLARAIADALDDYALYRPELLRAWEAGALQEAGGAPLPESQRWQPLLYRALRQRLAVEPFGLRVDRAVGILRRLPADPQAQPLRLFGISSLAPVQVRLIQALCGPREVEIYLLSPCPDLWQRCASRRQRLSDALALAQPLDADWLLEAPGLEARFGRLGAEFQQLLEGTGEDQIGASQDAGLFQLNRPLPEAGEAPGRLLGAPPASGAAGPQRPRREPAACEPSADRGGGEADAVSMDGGDTIDGDTDDGDIGGADVDAGDASEERPPASLLEQLQDQLAAGDQAAPLRLRPGDHSLEFHACPGPLRQVQIVRDRLLQLLHDHPDLEPRDILVMTPQIDRLAPLIGAVFGDSEATGVVLPWRLTDRSLQSEGGIARTLLALLQLAGERLTASGLEAVLACGPLQERFDLSAAEAGRLSLVLQDAGFRWGLDGRERGGDPTHSLGWAIDRLLLALVLPATPGLAAGVEAPVAPAVSGAPLELSGRWLHLLTRLRHWLGELGRPAAVGAWVERLRRLLADLFGDGGSGAAELPAVLAALDDWQELAGDSPLLLEAPVVAVVLREALGSDSGRFGHRSGALTISALEPMRAIPHRVIVLLGLDAGVFPRPASRPGFHLMEQRRRLGDPQPSDQDRYVLLEALLSARSHLLITWSSRDDRKGEMLQPATPVRQWLDWLRSSLGNASAQLLIEHPASPLEPTNFLPRQGRPPASCDRRQLAARRRLDSPESSGQPPLLQRPMPTPSEPAAQPEDPFSDLRAWLMEPQRQWLAALGLRPSEWDRNLEDLEPLALGERERSGLLRAIQGEADPPASDEDWLLRCRGQGLLPPRGGALLEARGLESRRRSLEDQIQALGDPSWQGEVNWDSWRSDQRWQGGAVLVVHLGRADATRRLDLWLQLLLAAAAGQGPSRGVLLSRDKGDRFATVSMTAPDRDQARAELERLSALRERWRSACWPLPPRTGWSWWERERSEEGTGLAAARQLWEGDGLVTGERWRPEMVTCFGGDLPLEALIDDGFGERARELFEAPLAALIRSAKGRGGRG